MFNIVLVNPEIPPNTGNVIRLCANTGSKLHLIEPLGFHMTDPLMKRAGLDYHEYADVKRYRNWDFFLDGAAPNLKRCFALTTKGQKGAFDVQFQMGDWFFFGSETQGLPIAIRESLPVDQRLLLPMLEGQRSLNLSNSVAILIYEAWRQNGFSKLPESPV
jgi:tRNA (cytidine/uridine-2'-O-)-methyltransferase